MKGKSKRMQMRYETSEYVKIDRVVQKSMNKEVQHYLNIANGGFFNTIKAILHNIFQFLFNNESRENMPYYGPVLPYLTRQNNSNKKWYKTHVPKSMRKGLTNRETTTLRRSIYSKSIKYV